MVFGKELLKKILIESSQMKEADFVLADQAAEANKISLWDYLVSRDIIKDEQLGTLVAEELGYKFLNLHNQKVDKNLFNLIPETLARQKGVLALFQTGSVAKVGMVNPEDIETAHMVEKCLGLPLDIYFITVNDFKKTLAHFHSAAQDMFEESLRSLAESTLDKEDRDQAIMDLVDNLLKFAFTNHASDIHIDPLDEFAVIRFRIDGILHDVNNLPAYLVDSIISRIKILAKMRTDEHRAAQDGKLQFIVIGGTIFGEREKNETVDVRVSIMPTVKGENVVMRILSAENQELFLEDLGLAHTDMLKMNKAVEMSAGMILVTGPTGSGKTTSLYSILKILNKREVNIATIEDPVEYSITGVTQIQVNPKTNLTFADGLRSLVRQDPNIIMVGEIRDRETAEIAVNASMTGHMVLSTLHTNDAATALPRFFDMGIEPFLLASTVRLIIAQRLVRLVCQHCRESYILGEEELMLIESNKKLKDIFAKLTGGKMTNIRGYRGKGCRVCTNTGYLGRIGIFEVLEMTENIKALVLQHASSDAVTEAAVAGGMTIMFEDGVKKMLNGTTTLAEVLRVTV